MRTTTLQLHQKTPAMNCRQICKSQINW